jgi:hypothetical protein
LGQKARLQAQYRSTTAAQSGLRQVLTRATRIHPRIEKLP